MKILLFFICVVFVRAQYEVPDATVEVFQPRGFTVSIPDEEGIKLFAFHGKINEDFDGLEAGTFARDILKPRNGSWVFRDRETRLKKGDIIYYWLYVDYNDGRHTLGYRKTDQQYEVKEFNQSPDAPKEKPKPNNVTISNTKVILFDDFSKKTDFWTVEQRYADAPDYPFVLYINNPEIFQIKDNKLQIKPVPSEDIFGDGFLTSTNGFDFGNSCTGPVGTQQCRRKYDAGFILPPIASAQLTTRNKIAFKYGKIEVRAKLPKGDWIYPEIYLSPAKQTYGRQSGQIRIAFLPGNNDMGHILHGGLTIGPSIAARNYFDKTVEQKWSAWSDDFHTFEVNWQPNEISFSVDGTVYGNIYPPVNGFASLGPLLNINTAKWKEGSSLAPFDEEMFLTLGVGVGGLVFRDSPSKPWRNGERNSLSIFNSARNQWQPTWSDNSKLVVDYVRITSL